ncbi:DUF4397 domain-containing protein [Bacillus sp. MRMR6]|uniref:DUF4397 domain-containing protein n=1 Tax=Bacillus sp. MRMR6 TaxID=1928617 RepID=UPI000953640D|nr:DUF4397 domain-containing protein [Bacillus sp. MRMR6]OLS37785.1 hypothetical protein BTR25_15850 [Bacillus sp. MRMR6]
MHEDKNHLYYLQKAASYDLLAQYYKYSSPQLHIHYYLKHYKNLNSAVMKRSNQQLTQTVIQNHAKIRFLHTSPDAQDVDIYINGHLILKNLAFKQISNYLSLTAGKYHIDIYPAGNMLDSVLNKKISIEPGKSYTFAAIHPVKKLRLLSFVNEPTVPVNESKIRFIHLSPNAPEIDIAVTKRDVVFPNISYKETTDYLGISPMSVDFELREAGSTKVIFPIPKADFKPNQAYTITIVGLLNEEPGLQVLIHTD